MPIFYLIFLIIAVNSYGVLFSKILHGSDAYLYAVIAKNIVESGDWINLIFNHQDWLDKPHFPFWITALSYKIFGINTFSYTFPGFIFYLIGALYTFRLAQLLFKNQQVAILSALFYLTSMHLIIDALNIKAEAFLLGTIIPACYYWYRYSEHEYIISRYLLLGAIFTALGIMTKGVFVILPIFSGVLSVAIFSKICFQQCNSQIKFKKVSFLKFICALTLSFVFITPELVALYVQFDLHPEKVIFGRTNVSGLSWFFYESQFGRFFNTGPISQSQKSWTHYFHYIHIFLWSFLPWVWMFPFGILKTIRNINTNASVYLLGSFIPTFLLFSLTEFQLDHYISIILPFSAILCANYAAHSNKIINHRHIAITAPSIIMCIFSIGYTLLYNYLARYDGGYQISRYLKTHNNKKIDTVFSYKLNLKNLEFFLKANQYENIESIKSLEDYQKPYYLIIKDKDFAYFSKRLNNNNQIRIIQNIQNFKTGSGLLLRIIHKDQNMENLLLTTVEPKKFAPNL